MLPLGGLFGSTPPSWQIKELKHRIKSHEEVTQQSLHDYEIKMAGQVDLEHLQVQTSYTKNTLWQPHISLRITNESSSPLVNPSIEINGLKTWLGRKELTERIIKGAKNDQEKVYLIWDFLRKHCHNDFPVFEFKYGEQLHDPIQFLLGYGGGYCDDKGSVASSLFYEAGFQKPEPLVAYPHGHMMSQVFAEGRWQFIDCDIMTFYLDRDNRLPSSMEEIGKDHDLIHREHHYGPNTRNKW
ncbi:MAG: transglutaminase domain-containing protein, partial [Planctomycetes bacterium]|nr:transglutaminase domain-containing protein [Planctomycetota bacterium]